MSVDPLPKGIRPALTPDTLQQIQQISYILIINLTGYHIPVTIETKVNLASK